MLGESPVMEGRAAAASPTAAGDSPSTVFVEREPEAAAATADVLTRVPEYSRTVSASPAGAGRAPSRTIVDDAAACVQCGGVRPEMAVKHGDPFCATRCARAFYGCPLDPASERPVPRLKVAA